jgi:hypothetical protein
MTTTFSKAGYADCFDLFDRALESPNGIRNACRDRGAAKHIVVRLNTARVMSRRESREVYAEDDPHFGVSPYDPFIIRAKEVEGSWWVYLEPRAVTGVVEELGAAE